MARLTDDQELLLLADFHTGQYNQRELAKKYGVSTATVNKRTNGIDPKHEHKVNAMATAHAQMEGESEQEVNAVQSVVNKQLTREELIYGNAEKLAKKLTTMTDQIDTPNDLKTLTEANDKLAITMKVAERHATRVEVNQNTGVQVNEKRVTIARRSDRA